ALAPRDPQRGVAVRGCGERGRSAARGGPAFPHRRPGRGGAGQCRRLARGSIPPVSERPTSPAELPRVMGLRDVVLFNITAIGGPRFVHLGDDRGFIAAVALVGLWLAVGLNVVGLRVGKWLQNLGGFGTWLPALIFVALAAWVVVTRGSATRFTTAGLVPARFDFPSINLFATMTFAYAGLELAPSLGGEIHDPAATLRRGVLLSSAAIVAIYLLGTVAMLVALPRETVSITNGMPQATAALVARLDVPGLGWVAAIVAALLVLGNVG